MREMVVGRDCLADRRSPHGAPQADSVVTGRLIKVDGLAFSYIRSHDEKW